MSGLTVGSDIITKSPLWHNGEDVGGRLGRVISTTGYVLVEIYNYESNPVKCFRHDIEVIPENISSEKLDFSSEDIEQLLDGILKP